MVAMMRGAVGSSPAADEIQRQWLERLRLGDCNARSTEQVAQYFGKADPHYRWPNLISDFIWLRKCWEAANEKGPLGRDSEVGQGVLDVKGHPGGDPQIRL